MHANGESSVTTLKPELYMAFNHRQWYCNLGTLERYQKKRRTISRFGLWHGRLYARWPLPRCLPCGRVVPVDVSMDMVECVRSHFAHPKISYDVLDIAADDVSCFVAQYTVSSIASPPV
ncbi:unnamed protein product [Ixodes hexagonus]